MFDIAEFSIRAKLVLILALKAKTMFTAPKDISSQASSMLNSRKKILSLLIAASMAGLSGLPCTAWSKNAPAKKAATAAKAQPNKTADKKKTKDKEVGEKTSARRKANDAAPSVKSASKQKSSKSRNDDSDIRTSRSNRKNQIATASKSTRPLTKAQKLEAEKQAKLAAAERARQERLETAQAARIAAAKREKQEAARQLQIARQNQLATEVQATNPAANPAAKNPAKEEDLIALQIAKSEALAQTPAAISTPVPAPVSVAALVPSTATAAATSNTSTALAPTSPALAIAAPTPAAVPLLVASSSTNKPAAALATNATSAAEANMAAAPATPERKAPESNTGIVRVSAPAREIYRPSQRLSSIRPGAAPDLYSSVAFVMDQNTGQILLSKNGHQTAPIASITKLMTAVITMDANLPMDELITITSEDVDRVKRSSSRLAVGSTLSRQELLHLALMSSENRAAHALGRTYPGGLNEAVRAMNLRALMLGMRDTRYVEPTGLSSANQSSAHDLAQLVKAAYRYPLIRNYTTYPGARFPVLGQMTNYNNTNRLIYSNDWNIGLQKTGFISEAGRCVVMQSNIAGRNIIIVLLDSNNSNRRAEDAEAIRYWAQNGITPSPAPDDAKIVAQLGASY